MAWRITIQLSGLIGDSPYTVVYEEGTELAARNFMKDIMEAGLYHAGPHSAHDPLSPHIHWVNPKYVDNANLEEI